MEVAPDVNLCACRLTVSTYLVIVVLLSAGYWSHGNLCIGCRYQGGFAIGKPLIISHMFKIGVKKEDSEVLYVMIAVLLVGLLQQMKSQYWNQTKIPAGAGHMLNMRTNVLKHLRNVPYAFWETHSISDLLAVMSRDMLALTSCVGAVAGGLTNIVKLMLTLIVFADLSWQLTLLLIVLLIVFAYGLDLKGMEVASKKEGFDDEEEKFLNEVNRTVGLQLMYD